MIATDFAVDHWVVPSYKKNCTLDSKPKFYVGSLYYKKMWVFYIFLEIGILKISELKSQRLALFLENMIKY